MGHGSARIARAVGVHPTDHPRPGPRRRHDHQPAAARRDHRRLRRLVGQARPRTHPLRTRRGHRRPQTRHRRELVRRRRPRRRPARHPRLPAPLRAGNPPPAPAPPPTSTRPHSSREGRAHDRRRTHDLGLHPRGPRRHWNATATAAATTSTPARPSDSSATWPASTRAPWTLPAAATSWCRHPGRSAPQPPGQPPRRHRLGRRGQDPAGRARRSRRIQAGPGRDCADCADQSCTTCQWRLQAADAYDQLAGQMIQAAEASAARQRAPDHAAPAQRRAARGRRQGGRTVTWHRTALAPCTTGQPRPVTA